ncbi:MAG: hypothetical protein JNL70_06430 [Saprospiraceae bacterium]|nr:hypothetical protein [Saprospiraceae bacterium]
MKFFKYSIFSVLAFALFAVIACEKVQSPLPDFETALTAEGILGAAPNNAFAVATPATPVNYKWGWKSIDNKNTVSKVEFFVTMTESYVDKDGNSRVANHGTKAWKVIDGSAAGANHKYIDGTITQAEVYNLFQAATFDYGKGGGKVSVWSQNGRTATARFTTKDTFIITWHITAADGRKFTEWSVGLCDRTTVGSNCDITFGAK